MNSCRLILTLAVLGTPILLSASEKDDADTLERLQSAVQSILPAGWRVDISPLESTWKTAIGDSPYLLISTKDKVPLEFNFPNPAPGQGPLKETQQIEIAFKASPLVKPGEYTALRKVNHDANQKRLDFTGKLRIQVFFMGAEPYPPWAYQPKTEKERRLVREYGFVWMRTEPKPLPTHYFGDLSFTRYTEPCMHIADESKAKEFEQIIRAAEKILKPYKDK